MLSYIIRNDGNSTMRRKIDNRTFNQQRGKDQTGKWLGIFSDDYKILSVNEHENNLIIYNV